MKNTKDKKKIRENRLDSSEHIAHHILLIRGQKVIIDADLANLYGVTTKHLNQQIKRNSSRFPLDFMFKLTKAEKLEVVTNCDHLENLKYSRENPRAFTEHGAIMAANVLNSEKATKMSVLVVRTFVKLRQILSTNAQIHQKFTEIENRLDNHDQTINALIKAIRQLMEPPESKMKHPIGFGPWPNKKPRVNP